MPKSTTARFRQVGIRGPGDLGLRAITLPGELGVLRVWRTRTPRGLHWATKRWGLLGPLVVRSLLFPEKTASVGRGSARQSRQRWRYFKTDVHGFGHSFEHAGAKFIVERRAR